MVEREERLSRAAEINDEANRHLEALKRRLALQLAKLFNEEPKEPYKGIKQLLDSDTSFENVLLAPTKR